MTFFEPWWPGIVGFQVFMLAKYYDAVYESYGGVVKGIYATFIPFWVGLAMQVGYSLVGFADACRNPNDIERPLLMQKSLLSLMAAVFLIVGVWKICQRLDFDDEYSDELPKWKDAGFCIAMASATYSIWLGARHDAKCACKKEREGAVNKTT